MILSQDCMNGTCSVTKKLIHHFLLQNFILGDNPSDLGEPSLKHPILLDVGLGYIKTSNQSTENSK